MPLNKTKLLAALATSTLFTGCASVTGTNMQPVSVQTIYESKELAGIGCTLTNDAGKWFVTTPGSVTVRKSTADMAVDCQKDGGLVGKETVVSKSNGSVWGNIILGGGIGYIVDRNTGAGFDYPGTITVVLRKIGEAVGITPSAPATAAFAAQ
mgnify:CR=1 FL=1|jgi:hypothetical protein|nr:hypothetical protein [Rhodoferax sp.]